LSTPALRHALSEIGADRIMFSADYPFEGLLEAARWFDNADIDESDRVRIGRANAIKLLKLCATLRVLGVDFLDRMSFF
jgi:predicted TIM-barrel fold metal-dependent hydrolase